MGMCLRAVYTMGLCSVPLSSDNGIVNVVKPRGQGSR